MAKKKPNKPDTDSRKLMELAFGPVASEFGQNSKGLGKKLAKAAGTTVDILNSLLRTVQRAPSTAVSGGQAFGRKFKALLSKRIGEIPADRRVRPLDAIAVPALHALTLRIDEPEIADMFATLLCSSMDRETAGQAHPAFVRVLSEIVSDEAKILRHLRDFDAVPAIDVFSTESGTGLVGARLEGLSLIAIEAGAENRGALPVYTRNLIRLGLVAMEVDEVFEDSKYEKLESSTPIRAVMEHVKSKGRIPELRRRAIRLTEFGRAFLRVCLPEEK